jgi:hypothetical protein
VKRDGSATKLKQHQEISIVSPNKKPPVEGQQGEKGGIMKTKKKL